jgi:hypothetical protein
MKMVNAHHSVFNRRTDRRERGRVFVLIDKASAESNGNRMISVRAVTW